MSGILLASTTPREGFSLRSRRNRTPFVTGALPFPHGVPMLFAPCLCPGLSLMYLASVS